MDIINETHSFYEMREDLFPLNILALRGNKKRDNLFYCLALTIVEHGHNTEPSTIMKIAADTSFDNFEKKEVLAAQLLLTYFEKQTE